VTVRVLADYHHSDLFESYQLTLGDRLGWEVYRPIGMEWFDEWYWSFERAHHGDAVARQYLALWDDDRPCDGYWERDDHTHPGRVLRGVTLDQARSQRWDVVISSVVHNDAGLARFAREAGATFGVQVGNVNQVVEVDWSAAAFGLCSTTLPWTPPVPHIVYRQEFSLTDFRPAWPREDARTVASFIQCFPENRGFYEQFLTYARALPEFDWRVYGAYGSAPLDEFACGNLETTPAVAAAMRRTRTAWHAKWWSDGFGHVIHNLFATGTPVVGPLRYYADKLAGELMVDGLTCFDIGARSEEETIALLRRLRDDDEFYLDASHAAHARFREVVDFDRDAERIADLLAAVLP
jgi:hypothetical protein